MGVIAYFKLLLAFPCLLLFLLAFEFPLPLFPLRCGQKDVPLVGVGLLRTFSLSSSSLASFSFSRWSSFCLVSLCNGVNGVVGDVTAAMYLEFFLAFPVPCLLLFLLTFELSLPPFLRNGVRVMSRGKKRDCNTPQAVLCVLWLPFLSSHVQVPFASFPSAIDSKPYSVGGGIATHLELLFTFPSFLFSPFTFKLRSPLFPL